MKKLYSFKIPKLVEVEEVTDTADGKLTKKVKKEVDQPFFIARPTREEVEEGEVFYTALYHKLCDEGIKPEILLRKRFGNERGIFTEEDKKQYVELFIKLGNNLAKIKELEDKKELTEEEKKVIADLYKDNKELQNGIAEYENAKQSVFDDSAEAISRKRTFMWWMLRLVYEDTPEQKPLFAGENHKERSESYDNIASLIEDEGEESKFYSQLMERAAFLVSLFYLHGAIKPAEFAKLVEEASNNIKVE
jgi:hypothetical protein